MDVHYPTVDELATPEYVLAVLQDVHRQQYQDDPEVNPEFVLSPDTTVAEWREACILFEWRKLARALNEFWGILCSDSDWQEVLEPATERQLSDVCALIARHAHRPRIRPAHFFGSDCISAGAFLTIRSLLHDAGASAEEITPSTLLAPYTRRYCELFTGPISRLAPGALPLVRVRHRVYDAALRGLLVGMVCGLAGLCMGMLVLAVAGLLLASGSVGLSWVAVLWLPTSVEFGELRTFRDLALVVSSGADA